MGWNLTSFFNRKQTDVLRQADAKIISTKDCAAKHPPSKDPLWDEILCVSPMPEFTLFTQLEIGLVS